MNLDRATIRTGPLTARGREVDVLTSTAAPPYSSHLFAFGMVFFYTFFN